MKFTIRDLLWLAAVVALTVGWFVEHRTMQIRFAVQEATIQGALEDILREQKAILDKARSAEKEAKDAKMAAQRARSSAEHAADTSRAMSISLR